MDKKMTVKMIATDMDGTLLDGQGQLDLPRLATILNEGNLPNFCYRIQQGFGPQEGASSCVNIIK